MCGTQESAAMLASTARAAQKAGIGGHEQQAPLEREHEPQHTVLEHGCLPAGAFDDGAKGHGVQRLPFHGFDAPQEIKQDDAPRSG
jgi:hypothetical protein